MTELSLKDRILKYIRNQAGFVASGDVQRLVTEKTSYTAQNAGRRMRELAEDGLLEVEYRKGHAFYRATSHQKTVRRYELGDDGVMREIVETVTA